MRKCFFILVTCMLLLSCAKEEKMYDRYTLSVAAVKGERPDTKALVFDGTLLKSVWEVGESVRVLNGNHFLGTLHAATAGDETMLSGTVSGPLAAGDALTLEFTGPYYTYQKGTLDYIASHCDYALANVTITGGTVIAQAGLDETGCRAIGPGEGSDDYGSLTLGDNLMVSSERLAGVDERKNMCWYRTRVRVEPCTHPGYTAATCPYHKH